MDAVGALDRTLWDRQMAINLTAPVFLAEAFAAQLPNGAEGNVVNLLDQRIWRPTPHYFSYQITKSALAHRDRDAGPGAGAAGPRQRHRARPGAAQRPPDRRSATAQLVGAIPLGRAPELTEFGRTVRYIVETRSITGQVIALDGGQHLA